MSDRPSSHAHYLILETAEAMGHELYDTMMRDDWWYDYWKKQNPGLEGKELEERFVKRNLSKLLPQARAAVTRYMVECQDESLKQTMYEALLLDNTLIRGRTY